MIIYMGTIIVAGCTTTGSTNLTSHGPTGSNRTHPFNTTHWTEMTTHAGWSPRFFQSSAAMRDGSIVLMGGSSDTVPSYNDVWRSTDNGATWTEMTADAGWSGRNGLSIVATPDNSIVLMGGNDFNGDKSDVWRSAENGSTWTEMTAHAGWPPRSYQSSVAMPDGSIVLMGGVGNTNNVITTYNDVWRSTDNGATWTEMTAHAGWPPRSYQSSVAMQDGSIVLMGGVGDANNNISHYNDVWRSTDNGATWTEMTAHAGWPPRSYQSSVAMQDGSIVLVGGEDTGGRHPDNVLRSTDNGATWAEIIAHAGWSGREGQSIVAMPDNSIVLMGGYSNGYLNDVWRSVPSSS